MTKKSDNENNLSASLKRNLKLRKKQVSERDDNKIIGKRTNKIGQSRLLLTMIKVILIEMNSFTTIILKKFI